MNRAKLQDESRALNAQGRDSQQDDGPVNQMADESIRVSMKSATGDDVKDAAPDYEVKNLGLGFYSSLSILVGLVVGSGIFSSSGPVYEEIGTFYGSTIIWGVSGLLSLLGALSYGELGAAYPRAGGEHVYLYKAFGSLFSFLFSFTGWITRPTSVSVISLSLSEFILTLVYGKEEADTLQWGTVGLSILLTMITVAACILSRFSSKWVQNLLCVMKLGLLLVIAITGLYFIGINGGSLAEAAAGNKSPPVSDSFAEGKIGKIAKSLYLALWGYDGWSNLNLVAEDMLNPSRNVPLVLAVGISLISAFYILTNMAYFAVLESSEITGVNSISTFAEKAYGSAGRIIILIMVCLSAYGALNSTIFCNTEVAFVAAKDKYAPAFLAKLNPRLRTPANALLFQALTSIIISLIFQKNYGSLVTFYSLPFWVFYAGASASLIYLRKKDPDTYRPFKTHLAAPIIFIVSTMFMIIFSFFETPYECVASIVMFLVGIACWYTFIHKSMRFIISRNSKIPRLVTVEGIYVDRK